MKHFQHCVLIVGNCVREHMCAHTWGVCVCTCVDGCELPSEWAAVVLELKNRPSPKSPSFTTPVAVMNTLAGLISDRGEQEGWRKGDTKITIWGTEILKSGSWRLTVKILIEGNTNQRVLVAFSLWFSCLWNVMPRRNYKWILNRHPVKWPLKLRSLVSLHSNNSQPNGSKAPVGCVCVCVSLWTSTQALTRSYWKHMCPLTPCSLLWVDLCYPLVR